MKPPFYTALKHLRRSPYQTIAATLVMAITFYLISIFTLVTAGSEKIIRYFETRPQVTAFFKDSADNQDIEKLTNQVKSIPQVESVKYLTKEDALAIYREQNKNDPLLLEMVTADILPASLEVSAKNPEILSKIAQTMENHPAVEEVIYQENIVNSLLSWTRAIRISGLGLVFALLFSSIVTIMVIISMKITGRRHEIEILRLLGATKIHILVPFLMEGVFYGSSGSILGWGMAYLTLLYATPLILEFFGTIPLLPVSFWLMLFFLGIQLLLGFIIGLFASILATRRYLR